MSPGPAAAAGLVGAAAPVAVGSAAVPVVAPAWVAASSASAGPIATADEMAAAG